ncbi:putative FAD binding domain-containing protein [Seiridium cardinale]|uniref:FAD binding domain-containing protein n=1 Tax=Seiridium cardinale TaxID=138064 RepID=A0ABR2XTG6_9PEZI
MGDTADGFRVVIVGGGPVALIAALALAQAGIDFVVLERRGALDLDAGASVAVWPHNVRLFDQLGLLEEAHRTYMPVLHKRNLRRDGSELGRNDMFERAGANHGHPWMCFRRAKLVNMIYQGIPDQNKVLFNKEVTLLEQTTTGVTAKCADGSVYKGAFILGADGVRSIVRREISKALGKADEPFLSSYRGMYGYTDRCPGLDSETLYETHSKDLTVQVIVGEEQQQFLIYERLEQPTREFVRYDKTDEEELARRYADVRFPGQKPDDWVTLGDIWDIKQWSTLANLEEGIVKKWHEGRFVLIGDAVHRMTPNIGFGMNSGLQGVVQLVNRLYALLKKIPEPDTETLDRLFREYQTARMGNSKQTVDTSGLYTRLVAWSNPVWRFTDQYILPYINGDSVALDLLMAPIVQKGEPLNFLKENGFKQGKYKYRTGPAGVSV